MLNLLDLGLRKVKQKTPAPQINSFHRTPQLEKHKDQKEIAATTQVDILFTTLKKHQHRNTANPNVPSVRKTAHLKMINYGRGLKSLQSTQK